MKLPFLRLAALAFFSVIISPADAQVMKPGAEQPAPEAKFPASDAFANSKITYKIINSANKTYGYDILADNKLLIHQPSIPGATGNNGFKTSASAEKVAQLVISKIKKGEMPPTVTNDDLKKLNAH